MHLSMYVCMYVCIYMHDRDLLQILGGCNEDVILEETRETVPFFVMIGAIVLVATAIQVSMVILSLSQINCYTTEHHADHC